MNHAIIGDIIRAGNVEALSRTQQVMYHMGKEIGDLSRNLCLPVEMDKMLWWILDWDQAGGWVVNDLDEKADDDLYIVNDDMSAFAVGLVEGHTGNEDTSQWQRCEGEPTLCECSRGASDVGLAMIARRSQ